MGIQTIFFDAAGTLFYLPKGVGWHYRDVALRFGCTLEADALSLAFPFAIGAVVAMTIAFRRRRQRQQVDQG